MKGDHGTDYTAARDAMREKLGDPTWKQPDDMTWHHHQDGVTMELVPDSIHGTGQGAQSPHWGGASLYGGKNKQQF